jgi:site-specific DNA recombinase
MSVILLNPPLTPRDGRTLQVVEVCRISTVNQDRQSLADQSALCRRYVESHYDGPVQWHSISHQGSGENIVSKELRELEDLRDSGTIDLIVTEDLARIMRRSRASTFCEECEDVNVRLIAVNENLDTAQEGWQLNALFSAFKGEQSNKDTSKRIKRSLDNRFVQGGSLPNLIYGYTKSPGGKTENDLKKDPAAEAIYDEWFQRLEQGHHYAQIADWLNAKGIPIGPTGRARNRRWDCHMVSRITRNPLLKGLRQRGRMIAYRVNGTGKHRTRKASAEHLKERHVPHLAFIDPVRFDRVIAMLNQRNSKFRRAKPGQRDPMAGRPRKGDDWPKADTICGVCGRPVHASCTGRKTSAICSGALDYHCWNGVHVVLPRFKNKMIEAITRTLQELPEFDEVLLASVQSQLDQQLRDQNQRRKELKIKLDDLTRKIDNLTNMLIEVSDNALRPTLMVKLKDLTDQKSILQGDLADLDRQPTLAVKIPTAQDLRERFRQAMLAGTDDPAKFRHLMRQVVGTIEVRPYRYLDATTLVLRAHFELHLEALVPELVKVAGGVPQGLLRMPMIVNLFDLPQRMEYLHQAVELLNQGLNTHEAAAKLGLTQPPVQRAGVLFKLMQERGLSEPWEPATNPPEGGRLFRNKHARYQFEPLPGYGGRPPETSTDVQEASGKPAASPRDDEPMMSGSDDDQGAVPPQAA